jgi:hypothetical protein
MRFSETAKAMKNIITRTPTKMNNFKFDSRTFDSRENFQSTVSARYSQYDKENNNCYTPRSKQNDFIRISPLNNAREQEVYLDIHYPQS